MLVSLQIKNIALINSLEINFQNGLNVLSGETGAGKSIIIDSLNFVLGKRADKTLIKFGENQASVSAIFNICDCNKAKDILSEFDIEIEDEIFIKRTMTLDGKNTCVINGQKVTLAMLKQLTQTLVDIYGQNDTMFILNSNAHLEILDDYGKETIYPYKEKQEQLHAQFVEIINKLNEYGSISELAKNIDLYEYQINEIEQADIKESEEEELVQLRKKMNNSQAILNSLNGAYDVINGDSSANILTQISFAISQLNKISDYDKEIEDLVERLSSAKIELKDMSQTIESLAEDSEFNPYEHEKVEQRLQVVRSIKKKYGPNFEDVINYLEDIKDKYQFLQNGEEVIAEYEIKKGKVLSELYKNALLLSKERKKVFSQMSKQIEIELTHLGMKNAKFDAKFNEILDLEEYEEISANGLDEMEFMFSANLGQPPRELNKIISGGELSRFMLALKNTISNLDQINTMVFDEIDSGISGNIAQVVAEKLYSISKDKQVLAITHLPQLASMADCNYLIEKFVENNDTSTRVIKLENDLLINEIARLIGNNDTSNFAVPHAKEMKAYANSLKK